MPKLLEKNQKVIIQVLGLIFLFVGAGKWLYDLIVLDAVSRWWVYLVMIIVGLALAGYSKIVKLLVRVKTGPRVR